MKSIFLVIAMSLTLLACSDGTQVGKIDVPGPGTGTPKTPVTPDPPKDESEYNDGDFNLTLSNIPLYSKVNPLRIDVIDFTSSKAIKNVGLWTSNDPCTNDPQQLLTALGTHFNFPLNNNSETLLSLKVTFEDESESKCFTLGAVVHDNIIPATPILPYNTLETGELHIHVPFSIPDTDAKFVNVYRNGLLIKQVNATLWKNGMGYFTVEEGSTNLITFTIEDRAGNISLQSTVLTVYQMKRDVDPPVVTSSQGVGINYGKLTTNPIINIAGTVKESSHVVDVYFAPNLHTPIGTYTSTQFLSGFNVTLADDALSLIMIQARDVYGNKSDLVSVSSFYVTAPVYNYRISYDTSSSNGIARLGEATEFSVYIYNESYEETSGIGIAIPSITTSSPYVLSEADCLSGAVSENSSCELFLSYTGNTPGFVTLPITLNFASTSSVVNFEVEVVQDLLIALDSSKKSTLGSLISIELPDLDLIYFENGITDGDFNVLSTDGLKSSIRGQQVLVKNGRIGVYDEKLYLWNDSTDSVTMLDSIPNIDKIVAIAEYGNSIVVALKDSLGSCVTAEYVENSRVGALGTLPDCISAISKGDSVVVYSPTQTLFHKESSSPLTFSLNIAGDVVTDEDDVIVSTDGNLSTVSVDEGGVNAVPFGSTSGPLVALDLVGSFITQEGSFYLSNNEIENIPGVTENDINFRVNTNNENIEFLIRQNSVISYYALTPGGLSTPIEIVDSIHSAYSFLSSSSFLSIFGKRNSGDTNESIFTYSLDNLSIVNETSIGFSGTRLSMLDNGKRKTIFSATSSGINLSEYIIDEEKGPLVKNENFYTLTTSHRQEARIFTSNESGIYFVHSKSTSGYDLFKMRKF